MLLQFSFKNYKSFRDDTTLDLTATGISDYSNHVVTIGHEKVLPVAAIFGANASGKSNIMEAFRYMERYVVSSLNYGGDEARKTGKSEFPKPTPFLLDSQCKGRESSFEVYFIASEEMGSKTYHYGFTVGRTGIGEEWLNYRAKSSLGEFKRIFYRNGNEIDMPGIPEKSRENLQIALEKETLLVSLGARLKTAKLKIIRDWFDTVTFADFGHLAENYFLSEMLPYRFVESEEVRRNVVRYFSAFDPSIIGFEVETLDGGDDHEGIKARIDAVHKMSDADQTTTIPLKQESAGTLKMFALYPLLQFTLDTGGVLLVDELNARLHSLLVRTLIITFLNPELNPRHAQLAFTSHDPWQLNSNMLRRDEIWFTEKSSQGVSTLYSLVDFVDEDGQKIRKDENYEKNYLLGKYGAIPSMKCFDMFTED